MQLGKGSHAVDAPEVRDAILRVRDLPTLPSVLGKILSTAADPDSSALDLGKLIASDQSLSATLLKLVNSAYYGFYRQIKSVTQAIVMLGFNEARNLTLTATAFRTLKASSSDYDRNQLWRHTLATAMAAEQCAKRKKLSIGGAFEAGLLHDIGKVAFDTLYPEQFLRAAHRAHEQQKRIAETEQELFGIDHAEVGGLLGEHWNLPPSVVEAIRHHHTPEQATLEPDLTALTAVANHITYSAELGESSNSKPPAFPEAAAERLGITADDCQTVADSLRENEEQINEVVGTIRENA